jgi:hypothetical protein
VGQGVGQGRHEGELGETLARARLSSVTEEVDSGADVFLDRSQQEDELRDYERMCATGESSVYAAMSRHMVRRLARSSGFSIQSL